LAELQGILAQKEEDMSQLIIEKDTIIAELEDEIDHKDELLTHTQEELSDVTEELESQKEAYEDLCRETALHNPLATSGLLAGGRQLITTRNRKGSNPYVNEENPFNC